MSYWTIAFVAFATLVTPWQTSWALPVEGVRFTADDDDSEDEEEGWGEDEEGWGDESEEDFGFENTVDVSDIKIVIQGSSWLSSFESRGILISIL